MRVIHKSPVFAAVCCTFLLASAAVRGETAAFAAEPGSSAAQSENTARLLETARNQEAPVETRVAALRALAEGKDDVPAGLEPALVDIILERRSNASLRIAAIQVLNALGFADEGPALAALVLAREEGAPALRALGREEMGERDNFAHVWDFDTVWTLEEGGEYPVLRRDPVAPEKLAAGGAGTADDPFLIATAEQLDRIRDQLGADTHFRQVADIDLAGFGDPGKGWRPISGQIGSYDGGGYRIFNLAINRPGEDDVGLFGKITFGGNDKGHLSRIALENAQVVGRDNVGILAGNLGHARLKGKVENAYATGTVSGRKSVGGLVGRLWAYPLVNCHVSVQVQTEAPTAILAGVFGFWGGSAGNSFYDADRVGVETVDTAALKTLRRHRPGLDSTAVLYRLMRSDDVGLRYRAAAKAAVLNPDPERMRTGLAAALRDDRFDVRRQARQVLNAYGDEAKASVAVSLADAYTAPEVLVAERVRIARAVGELAVDAGVSLLLTLLEDPAAKVRRQVVDSLCFLDIPSIGRGRSLDSAAPWWKPRAALKRQTVAALEGLTSADPDPDVREAAHLALSRIRGTETAPAPAAPAFTPPPSWPDILPEAEKTLLETAYAEVDANRLEVLEKYAEGVAWPFFSTAIIYHASAHLYLNRNVETANRLLMEQIDLQGHGLTSPAWAMVYGLYNSRSRHFPGRMSPEAEALFKQRMFEYVSGKSADFEGYIDDVWRLSGTENHHITFGPVLWYLYLGHLSQDPDYASRELPDGQTVAQWRERWSAYMVAWLDGRAKNGFWVELGAGYMKYSLPGIFALYTDAVDPEVRQSAHMFLDLYFVDEAQISFGVIRGGSRSRADSQVGTAYRHILSPLFGRTVSFPGHLGLHDAVVSGYRPPPEAMLLQRDYQYPATPLTIVNRRLGEIDDEGLTPDSTILNLCYKTRHYLLGSALRAPDVQFSPLFGQHFWNGLIFANGDGVYPDPVQRPGGRFVDPYYSFQHQDVLIFQKNPGAYGTGAVRVYVKPGTERVERDGWVFVDDGEAYAAIRVLDGGYGWANDKRLHIVPEKELAPMLIQGGDVDAYGSFEAFMTAIQALTVTWDGEKVAYTGPGRPRIEFFSRSTGKLSRVDGVELDTTPEYVYNSPFLKRRAGEPTATVTVGPLRRVYDFEIHKIRELQKR